MVTKIRMSVSEAESLLQRLKNCSSKVKDSGNNAYNAALKIKNECDSSSMMTIPSLKTCADNFGASMDIVCNSLQVAIDSYKHVDSGLAKEAESINEELVNELEIYKCTNAKAQQIIADKNPPSQIQIKECNSKGVWGSGDGRCNVSAMTTLLNRRVALDSVIDNKTADYFSAEDVLIANGCTVIKDHGNKKDHYHAIQYEGQTGSMYSKTYSNGTDTYVGHRVTNNTVKSIVNKSPYNGSYESYIADMLEKHPEGLIVRNTKAVHVAVITGYRKEGGKIVLSIDDSYNSDAEYSSFQGDFSKSYMYSKGGKSNFWNNLDYISYLE